MSSTHSHLHRAGRWFLESGIQDPSGGVARYYRSDAGRHERVSSEITGYAISALVCLHQSTGRGGYREAAVRAADFLADRVWDPALGLFPFEHSRDGDPAPALAYFFDSGIIARGLLTLWRSTGAAKYRDAAVACGRSMIRDFTAAASFHPILVLPAKEPLTYEPRWSRGPGCYQLKAAMAWHDLFAVTGEADFERHYERAVEESLASHGDFLAAQPDRESVMDRLHAYSYFLEGLLPCAQRPRCAAALREGLGRVAENLRSIAPAFERSDVYAQLLRARLYAAALGVAPLDRAAAEYEAGQAAGFQFEHTDPRLRDGFWFGRKGGQLMPFVNPVSTAFCMQALDQWRQYQEGEFRPVIESLI
ncbi:MAG: hypothetical protein HY822_01335 [Acidobacteria bacterium]|nr:hypothetical protein [Acidobacteriota bacterium]